jgi:predicted outer membrane repeat protein
VSFELKDGVALYGGFAGSETSLEQRDVLANPTVLSGDIDQNDTVDSDGVTSTFGDIVGDNSTTVVFGEDLSTATILDGFTISAGNSAEARKAGGLTLYTASPILRNLTIIGNKALSCSAVVNDSGSPQLTHSSIIANQSSASVLCHGEAGTMRIKGVSVLDNQSDTIGAFSVFRANVEIEDSLFENNTTNGEAGALGLYESSASSIRNTQFISNTSAIQGGALYTHESTVTLDSLLFDENTSEKGGAIYTDKSKLDIINSHFTNNSASTATSDGGAIYGHNHSEISLKQSEFIGNTAPNGGGGAIFSTTATTTTVESALFRDNHAWDGGAVSTGTPGTSTFTNVRFEGNSAEAQGGALNLFGDTTLTNVVFSGNTSDDTGGALASASGTITMSNASFNGNHAANSGGGIANSANLTINNSILWGNTPQSLLNNGSSQLTVASSLIEGCNASTWDSACGTDGGNNLADADPQFVSPVDPALAPSTTGHLMLKPTSPAIDQGDNSLNSSTLDAGGAPRVANGTIDLGAYEWQAFTFNLASEGQGTAQATPQQASYQPGEQVQLSANAAAGWEFAGWSGTFVSSVPTATLTIAQSHVITATFRNLPPVVVVGADQTVDAGATVTLDASASHELDTAQTLTFAWLQVGGTSVTLSDADTAQPSFTAPAVNGVLVFQVVVSDNLGAASDPVLVQVTVQNGTDGWTIFLPAITTE